MAVIRCPHCGTANREGSNFCNSCGVDLRGHEEARDRGADQESQTPHDTPQPAAPKWEPPQSARETPGTQDEPWLSMDFSAEADAPPFDREEDEDDPRSGSSRLLSSTPGLLAPVRVAVSGEASEVRPQRADDVAASDPDLWRRVRTRMGSPPLLAGLELPGYHPRLPDLRLRWIFLALALAVTVPAISIFAWPSGSATEWPGVAQAFEAVNGLPANADVLIYWAYDPATAGELDLEALPVTTHLFQRRTRISVVTLLPGGPATARRLINRARLEWQRTEDLTSTAQSTWTIPVVFLPGGSSMLALVAQSPGSLLPETLPPGTASAASGFAQQPDLSVLFAAQADDVQHWLEQVQPLSQAPVIAVVGAGADPVLRPYLDSGQLSGLVSGFDGAYNYRRMLDEQARTNTLRQLDMQLVLQDWGQFVFFLVIIIGNFAEVMRRGHSGRSQ